MSLYPSGSSAAMLLLSFFKELVRNIDLGFELELMPPCGQETLTLFFGAAISCLGPGGPALPICWLGGVSTE